MHMEIEAIAQRKREITDKFGEWTNHNIRLDDDIYTIGQQITGAEVKLRRILQAIADIVDRPFEKLRVLDLACLEGLYGIELALHGAEVVAIEGREANIEKARFVKDVLSLHNLQLVQDDVRNLSREKYGCFDVVLCIGIFYHLDAPDVFSFLEQIADVCQKLVILDTHVSMSAEKCYIYKEQKYWGCSYVEHKDNSTAEEKNKSLWASLENLTSFWLTRASLYNLLSESGFTSVYECHNPAVIKYEIMRQRKEADRNTFLGIKGKRKNIISSPIANKIAQERWPEKEELEL
ncbi:class I SAM-dependent methyltransferase [Argonema galeatum]|uniref:class I SAM-dependent methyltransferase n=1 Tax=Argonema galeatum TaxID=2942762 RepID=UPI002013303A|nr:class I SAM-dependent methyltransferase [Argonema galeatum]MCL1465876.1 class I SAM-dependent methyltransferase [Argonema galeatum A003/A1]